MPDPLGIIGVIAVAGHIVHLTFELGLNWKDAPADAKSFLYEIQTLKTVLSETHVNFIINEDFKAAFEGRRSVLLQQLGEGDPETPETPKTPTSTFSMVENCKKLLDNLLSDVQRQTKGHRFGWERLKGAFMNDRLNEAVKDLNRQCQYLNSLISIDALALALETNKELKQTRQENKDWRNEQRSKEILDWLANTDYRTQQSDFLRARAADTGQWLLVSQEYQRWVATPQTTLFCPGIPGAGKTMLTSIVVDDLQKRLRDDGHLSIAYLYCNFKRQTEQTVENLLSSVLRQLAETQQTLPECIAILHEAQHGRNPSLNQLSSTLQVLVKTLPRAFIIVDALDECQLEDGCRSQFLDEMFGLQSGSNVNLFATSRLNMEITDRFSDAAYLEIRAHEEDVRRYLAGRISQLPACVAKNPDLQEEIMTKIVEAVDGMFLLAQLHLNSLKGKRSAKMIRTALGALHTGSGAYDKAYDDAMERIASQLEEQAELARQVLMWVTCAVRPLSTIELQEALAVEVGETELDPENVPEIEDIISVCAGLVTVDDESKIIRLVHYTTQEYFSRTSDRWFPGAHCNITKTCITYLTLDMFNDSMSDVADGTYMRLVADFVLYYAFEHWVNHASMSESKQCNQMVSNFLSRRCSITGEQREDVDRLYSLHDDLFDALSSFGRDELARASATGGTRHVQYLLERGALPNAKYRHGRSPLSCAVASKHTGIVEVLLEWDAVDVNHRDFDGRTPLFLALEKGERAIIEMLLRARGIDTTVVSFQEETLLHAAATGGLEDIFKMFLDMDVNKSKLNAPNRRGSTPLHLAAKHGHVAVVQILLDSEGIRIHAKRVFEWTPLHLAAEHGHVAVVRILLDADGINIHAKGLYGTTPLHLAAQYGHTAVVYMLLDFDLTSISARDRRGRTPFFLAAEWGREDAIRAILDFDPAAIKTADDFGSTPLHEAAKLGKETTVRLLYDLDSAAISARTDCGKTPLHLGSRSGVEPVVQTLLGMNGVEVDARHNDGSTSIHDAASSGSIQVLQLLLNTGKLTANDEDKEGRAPIWKAVEGGHWEATQYLLSVEGVNTDRTNSRGCTLLHCAAEAGDWEVVEVLLASGRFNVNQTSRAGETPLLLATLHGQGLVVETLLGVDGIIMSLIAKDSEGRTALSVAVETGYKRIFELLKAAHEKFGVKHDGI